VGGQTTQKANTTTFSAFAAVAHENVSGRKIRPCRKISTAAGGVQW
jgi:hypothetical protein